MRTDALAALAFAVTEAVLDPDGEGMCTHEQSDVREERSGAAGAKVLRDAGVVVLPPDPSETMCDAAEEAEEAERQMGGGHGSRRFYTKAMLRAALDVLRES